MGNATSAYMVCGRSIIDCGFILRFPIEDCISACITVSMIIVDGLVDKHKEQVFPKDEFTESMIS